MTDKEIVKILEYCSIEGAESCVLCPLFHKENCFQILSVGSLNIIKRQQAEINRQKAEIEKLQLSRKQKLKEIERLSNKCESVFLSHDEEIGQAKKRARAEAIKEFADKLSILIRKQLTTSTLEKKEAYCFCLYEIDKLLEETAGDTK